MSISSPNRIFKSKWVSAAVVTKTIAITSIFSSFFVASTVQAAWTKATSPVGKVDLLSMPTSSFGATTIYAGQKASGTIYKSVDGGVSWIPVNISATTNPARPKTIDAMSNSPSDANKLYVVGEDSQYTYPVFFSTDNGGTTWTSSYLSSPLHGLAVSNAKVYGYTNSYVNGASSAAVYAKDSFGVQFVPTGYTFTGDNIVDLEVIPSAASAQDTLVAATFNGIYISTNSGASFSPVHTGSALPGFSYNTYAVSDIAVDPSSTVTPTIYVAVKSFTTTNTSAGIYKGTVTLPTGGFGTPTVIWTNVTGTTSQLYTALAQTTTYNFIDRITVDSTQIHAAVTQMTLGVGSTTTTNRVKVYSNNDKISVNPTSWTWSQSSDVFAGIDYENFTYDLASTGTNVIVAGEKGIHYAPVTGSGVPLPVGSDLQMLSATFSPATVQVGGSTTLMATVRNGSTTVSYNQVRVEIQLPFGMTYNGVAPTTTPAGLYATCTGVSTTLISCTRSGALTPGQQDTLNFSLTMPATLTSTQTFTARVSDFADTNTANNSVTASLVIGASSQPPGVGAISLSTPSVFVNAGVNQTVTGQFSVMDSSVGAIVYATVGISAQLTGITNSGGTFTISTPSATVASATTPVTFTFSYTRPATTAALTQDTVSLNLRDSLNQQSSVSLTLTFSNTGVPGGGGVRGSGGGGALHPLWLLAFAIPAIAIRRKRG